MLKQPQTGRPTAVAPTAKQTKPKIATHVEYKGFLSAISHHNRFTTETYFTVTPLHYKIISVLPLDRKTNPPTYSISQALIQFEVTQWIECRKNQQELFTILGVLCLYVFRGSYKFFKVCDKRVVWRTQLYIPLLATLHLAEFNQFMHFSDYYTRQLACISYSYLYIVDIYIQHVILDQLYGAD